MTDSSSVLDRNLRWSSVPWGLLGAIVLAIAVEQSLARQPLSFTRPECWDWRISGQVASRTAKQFDVLCLGTSMTQQCLLPRVIKQRTGRRARNLAVCWGQVPRDFFLLRRALDAGAKPRALIIDVHPCCIAFDYRSANRFWPEFLGMRECLELSWTARDASFFASTTLAILVPSIRSRLQIRTNIQDSLRDVENNLSNLSRIFLRNLNQNQGAMVQRRRPDYEGTINEYYASILLPDSWGLDPTNVRYLEELLALAASRGITVYWLIPPFAPALQERRVEKGLDAAYTRFVRDFQGKFPNLVILDARYSGYVHTVFNDAAHLDRQGAITLSNDVAEALRRSAVVDDPARWIELPHYRDLTVTAAVEDLGQSEAAVGLMKVRR
jgi:hypothetical protein